MTLTWYGHAAFLLEGSPPPVRIVLDPYRAPDVGTYTPINDWADVVAISHENAKYHSHVAGVAGKTPDTAPVLVDGLALLESPGEGRTIGGATFSAVRVWENDEKREPIAMVIVEMNGVRFLHMGDCGHALPPEDAAACGTVDVLLALAGGPPTLALSDLTDFIKALRPRVVVSMHFGNDKINLNLRPIEDFLAFFPPETVHGFDRPTIDVSANALPPVGSVPQIWVLPPAR